MSDTMAQYSGLAGLCDLILLSLPMTIAASRSTAVAWKLFGLVPGRWYQMMMGVNR
jgi:hypothetical protein